MVKWICLAMIVAISGCSQKKESIYHDTVLINNLPVEKNIEIKPQETVFFNDLFKVVILVTNRSSNSYNDIVYRFKWFDQYGNEVAEHLSVWKPLFLEPYDYKVISQLSPDPKVEKYAFYIKEGNNDQIQRIDPKSLQNNDFCYGVEELHLFIEKMVTSMLGSKIFIQNKPIVSIAEIQNKTGEMIDTKALESGIKTALLKSGRVRFIDTSFRDTINKELEYQNNSVYIDSAKAHTIGKQLAPDFILEGAIFLIKKRDDFFYKIVLQLHNIQQGTIDWAEEKEVRKVRDYEK